MLAAKKMMEWSIFEAMEVIERSNGGDETRSKMWASKAFIAKPMHRRFQVRTDAAGDFFYVSQQPETKSPVGLGNGRSLQRQPRSLPRLLLQCRGRAEPPGSDRMETNVEHLDTLLRAGR
jgi:hypothetical protein